VSCLSISSISYLHRVLEKIKYGIKTLAALPCIRGVDDASSLGSYVQDTIYRCRYDIDDIDIQGTMSYQKSPYK
jgi:hypothetical protein